MATRTTPVRKAWRSLGWLAGIIVNLLLVPGYFDVALRDFGLLVGALALQRLATARHRGQLVARS